MRVVIQRVKEASVTVANEIIGSIEGGLMVLVGIENADTKDDIEWLANKITGMRIFDDAEGVMNLSIKETGGDILLISQFTLHALTRKGNRPSYIRAAGHEKAVPLYEHFCKKVSEKTTRDVKKGIFAADMKVALVNDGPVTILIDSKNKE